MPAPKVLNLAMMATRHGVAERTAYQYTLRDDFPPPVGETAQGRIWMTAQVEEWWADRPGKGAGGGRPPKRRTGVGALVRIPPEMRFGGELAEVVGGTGSAWRLRVLSADPEIAGAETAIDKQYARSAERDPEFLIRGAPPLNANSPEETSL